MKILAHLRGVLPKWSWLNEKSEPASRERGGESHLSLAQESLRELLEDARVPDAVRESLAEDYRQIEVMLEKLEHGHVHVAVFGRVSVGKSALLNALLGAERFSTSPLHGETRSTAMAAWDSYDAGGVFLMDTPGINEAEGEDRELIAFDAASRVDLVLFVVDGDITDSELQALRVLAGYQRPIILVLNKSDRYSRDDRNLLMETLRQRTRGIVDTRNLVCTAAQPAERIYVTIDEDGNETETLRRPLPDVEALRERLWEIMESEGKTLSALNASLFAGRLSSRVAEHILEVKRELADKLLRSYSISKGIAVSLNPVPITDLLAAAMIDAGMVVHLSKLYGLPLTRQEAGGLVKTIASQMLLLMGTVWAVHLVSSALKVGTAGVSTVLTAGAQGAVAYYSTYVVGRAAERYLAQGKSWGESGPKSVVREILDSLDRESILRQAKSDIQARLRSA